MWLLVAVENTAPAAAAQGKVVLIRCSSKSARACAPSAPPGGGDAQSPSFSILDVVKQRRFSRPDAAELHFW